MFVADLVFFLILFCSLALRCASANFSISIASCANSAIRLSSSSCEIFLSTTTTTGTSCWIESCVSSSIADATDASVGADGADADADAVADDEEDEEDEDDEDELLCISKFRRIISIASPSSMFSVLLPIKTCCCVVRRTAAAVEARPN